MLLAGPQRAHPALGVDPRCIVDASQLTVASLPRACPSPHGHARPVRPLAFIRSSLVVRPGPSISGPLLSGDRSTPTSAMPGCPAQGRRQCLARQPPPHAGGGLGGGAHPHPPSCPGDSPTRVPAHGRSRRGEEAESQGSIEGCSRKRNDPGPIARAGVVSWAGAAVRCEGLGETPVRPSRSRGYPASTGADQTARAGR